MLLTEPKKWLIFSLCILVLACFGSAPCLAADTTNAWPVSLLIPSPSPSSGEIDSKPVGVVIGTNSVFGEVDSNPVSVVLGTNLVFGDVDSKPVSLVLGSNLISGEVDSMPVSVAIQPANLNDPDLVGLWHMDGNWLDSSGSMLHGLSNNSPTFSSDHIFGTSSGSFNGSSAVAIGNLYGKFPNNTFSIEAWVKLNDTGNGARRTIAGGTGAGADYSIGLSQNQFVAFVYDGAGTSGFYAYSGVVPTIGQWYHVTGTYDGTTLRIYVNGALMNTIPAVWKQANGGADFWLGGEYCCSSDRLNGLIDEVAVYRRALTDDEIAVHYAAGISDPAAPAAPVMNSVPAIVGTNTIALSGTSAAATAIWVNNRKVAVADASGNWSGTYSTLTPGPNILNVTAVDSSFRLSPPATANVFFDNLPPVIASSTPANGSNTAKTVGSVTINLYDASSPVDLAGSIQGATVNNSAGQPVVGSWRTAGTSSLVFTPATPFPADTYTVSIQPVDAVGNRGQQSIVFTNHDTSAPTTKASLSGTLDSAGWYSTPVTVTLTPTDGDSGSGVAKTEYSLDNVTWQTYATPFVLDKDGDQHVWFRSTDQVGNVESPAGTIEVRINQSGLVGLWHMDGDWKDASVMGNDLTPVNGTTFSSDAKIGTMSAVINGSNTYLRRSSGNGLPLGNSPRTYTAWIKPFSYPDSTYNGIVAYGPMVCGKGSLLSIKNDGRLSMAFWCNDAYQTVGPPANLNEWNQVVLTYDGGTTVKFYMNGQFVQESSLSAGTSANTQDGPLRIGSTDDPGRVFNGLIDDVSIYNRALSATEIQGLYRNYVVNAPTVDPVASPTNSATITLSGTKPADTAVVVNGTVLVPLDSMTTWRAPYTLSPGANTISVTAQDGQNFDSLPATLTVALDVTPPQVTAATPPDHGIVRTAPDAITLTLADAFSPLDLTATLTGASVTNQSGFDVPGSWSTTGTGTTGTATFTPAAPLAEGTYSATIHPTDTFGNSTTYSMSFTVDSTPPAAPTIDPIPAPVNSKSRTITGTKSTDSTNIIVSCAGATAGSVGYPSATTWSVNISGLAEGTNTVTAAAVDAAGNQSAPASMTFTVDTVPPGKPVINAPESPTRNTTVTLTGTKDAGSYLYVNGQKSTVPFADASWSYTSSLREGSNGFTLYARDEAGNQSPSVSVSVVRDTTPPAYASSTPTASAYAASVAAVSVTLVDAGSGVDLPGSLTGAVVKDGAGAAVSGAWSVSGSALVFTPAATLPQGSYTVALYPVDTLGNRATAPVTFGFTVDTTPPTVQGLSLNPASPVKAETVSFTLTFSEAMSTATQPVVTFTSGFFSPMYSLTGSWADAKTWRGSYVFTAQTGDGTYTVKAAGAKDLAGNVMADQQAGSFVLVTNPPATPTVGTPTTPTRIVNQTLTGTKQANTAIVINGAVRVPVDTATTWSYSYPLTEGANTLAIVARDAAGNDSPPITPAPVITLDTTPPLFTVDTFQATSPSVTQTLSGKKEPGALVKLTVGNGTVTVCDATDQNPTWSYAVTLADGITNHLVFTAADALGNTTTKSLDILCDTAPPQALAAGMLVADGSGKGTDVTLSWPSYIEPANLAYYRIYTAVADFTSVTSLTPVGTTGKGTKTFAVSGLTQGTTYWFAVVPVSVSGNSDPTVHTASAIPADTLPPEEVTGLSAWAGYAVADGNTVTLSWTPSVNSTGDLADQVLYMDGGQGYAAGTSLGKTATSFVRKALNDATAYKFKVTTKDTLGHESAGTVVTAVTRLPNPAGLSATPGSQKVSLAWNPVNSPYVKVYNVYRLPSAAPQTDVSAMTLVKSQTGTSYTDTGLVNGTTYQYAVTTLNSSGAERTDVQSVAVAPRGDTTGPVIGAVNLTANQVVTAPITVTASAQDAESAMGRMEIRIDGVLAASQNGGSLSFAWDVVSTTDGNHTVTIDAYDAVGNVTEQTIPVVVSLAPPPAPVITSTFTAPINQKSVTITGTAQAGSTVSLRVNGVVVAQQAATTAPFTFTNVALSEGDNLVAAKAGNRGGDSPYSVDTKVAVVTVAPGAPVGLAAKPLAGGSIQFTWQAGASGVPVGYNLYEVPATFASLADAGVKKTNSTPIPYLLKEYIPADDNARSYVVTAVDGAGNESPASTVVTIASDRVPPGASGVVFTNAAGVTPADNTYGPGIVNVAITTTEPLGEAPFFSLEAHNGSPVVVAMTKVDDIHYGGSFTLDVTSPFGPTSWKFSGKDLVGNRGSGSGTGPTIDVRGPVATVTAPVTLLKTTAGAVPVVFTLDEPSTTPPTLTLKASDGTTATATGLVSADGGLSWSGTLDPGTLPEGTGQFLLAGAKDRFGNVGTTVTSGASILLYQNSPPAPAVPAGLVAKAGKGGSIALSWTKVADAQGYNVYRQGAGDAAPVLVSSIATGATVTYADTPAADGSYAYSVSSLGLLGVESAPCAQVSTVSDRTPPSVPTGLVLAMTGNGVQATWDKVAAPAELPASYRLYRANGVFTDVTGLTPVATASGTTATATDPAPASAQRFYAVTALDSLGNESALTPAEEITFPVAPVANLLLTLVDDGKPTLSWGAGEANVQGYFIYRNGARINQSPTTSTSYSDGYYAGGAITYGVSAVDVNGTESPIKEVTLPAFSLTLKDGTAMHRGVLETVPLVATLPADATGSLNLDAVSIKIGTLPESTLTGPFTVVPGTPLEIDKVAATEATAPPQEAVVVSAILHPAPGTTVKITRSSLVSVLGAGTALEIYNDPLVRGTTASVRIKVNNLGSARTEFLTSENGGPTSHVRIYLRDQDGNLLAQGSLDQRTGSVVNSGNYATARLEPGESFLSDPITFAIPATAPSKVSIEAVIDNTYYHYNQDDQVTAPGLTQSVDGTIADVSYMAAATTDKSVYRQGEPVVISGHATSTVTGAPMPFVPVKIGVSVKGFDRFFTVNTDAAGAFSYTFTPTANETGSYSVWASHPDLTDRSVQAQFSIIGLSVAPTLANVTILKGQALDIPVTLTNLGGSPLTGLALTPASSSGVTATVVNPGSDTLAAGEKRTVTFHLATDANAADTGFASLAVATAEGLGDQVNANVTLVNPLPIIATAPSYIDTGLVRGTQRIASFTITNTGYDTLQNAHIEGPSLPWLSLTIDKTLGDIPAGQSKSVGILINPSDTVPQGVYNDRLVIYADNHIPYTYNIQVTVTSSAVGSVQFSVLDELMKQVGGASITLQNQSLPELLYTLTTGADGTASLADIPEGRYSFNVTAAGHKPYGASFVITPGVWTTVPVGLEVNLVNVEWSVTPTTIQDQYQITVNQTFATNVPAPVLVTEPASVTLPDMQPGEVYNGEFTVTNYGLIAVDNPQLKFPTSFGDYDVEILSVMPSRIDAMQKITVPYRITRRQATTSTTAMIHPDVSVAGICSEIGGYGGGACVSSVTLYTTGTAVICPNTPQQRTVDVSSPYTVGFPTSCPSGTSTIGTYVPPPPTFVASTSGTCTNCQSSGGGGGLFPGGSTTQLQSENPCDCKPDGTPCPDDGDTSTCDVCKGGTCSHLPQQECYCIGKNDGTLCDDHFYCTSYDGEHATVDECISGKCVGKEIKDKELGSYSFYNSEFETKLAEYGKKSILPGCVVQGEISISGGLKETQIERCCEKYKAFEPGTVDSGSLSLSIGSIKCSTAPKILWIGEVPVAYTRFIGTMGISGSATVSGGSKPCGEDCDWKVEMKVEPTIKGGIEAALITSLVNLDVLKVTGTVNGSGSFGGTFGCHGDLKFGGCFGKVEAELDVTLIGFIHIKPKEPIFEGWCW